MNPKISIIIPAYNCENTICRTINSILNQLYGNIEIIVVNDGSTDKTKEIVKKYKNNINLYNNNNKGVCYSRNFGIQKASGDYILFVDADDTIDRDFIQKMVDQLNEGQLVGGKIRKIINKEVKNILPQMSEYSKEKFIGDLISGKIDGYIWRYLFAKRTLKNVKFDENLSYMEDTVFLIKYILQNNISKVKFVNSFYNYYNCDTSVTNKKNNTISTIKNIKNAINQINNYKEKIKYIDVEYYCSNRKAKLYESQLYKINTKKEFRYLKSSEEIKKEITTLVKSKKTKVVWKIFYTIIMRTPYSLFCVYKRIRMIIKRIVRS